MSGTPATNVLDHIIHLTTGQSLDVAETNFKDLGFTVVFGGKHADGVSSNMLIVLQDGIYLELLIFNDPIPPSEHWWADRQPGWIDQASAGSGEHMNTLINDRLGYSLFKPSVTGGRFTKGPEGEARELKWRITQPHKDVRKGEVPFFTEDLTPRSWRVPAIPASNTIHDNGALGVASITYIAPASNIQAFSAQLAAFYGVPPSAKVMDGKQVQAWSLTVPSPIEISGKALPTELYLRGADSSIAGEVKRGTGLYEVTLWTSKAGPSESIQVEHGRIKFRDVASV